MAKNKSGDVKNSHFTVRQIKHFKANKTKAAQRQTRIRLRGLFGTLITPATEIQL